MKSLQTLSHKCQVNHGIVNNCTFLGAEGPALVITGDKVRLFFIEDIISSYVEGIIFCLVHENHLTRV